MSTPALAQSSPWHTRVTLVPEIAPGAIWQEQVDRQANFVVFIILTMASSHQFSRVEKAINRHSAMRVSNASPQPRWLQICGSLITNSWFSLECLPTLPWGQSQSCFLHNAKEAAGQIIEESWWGNRGNLPWFFMLALPSKCQPGYF